MIPIIDEINNELGEKIDFYKDLTDRFDIPESYIFPIEKQPLMKIMRKTAMMIVDIMKKKMM